MRHCLIFAFLTATLFLQGQNLTGTVTNEKGEKLEFAVIFIQGTKWTAVSEKGGTYSVENLKPGEYTVSCSFLGYETISQSIRFPEDKIVNFVMRGNIYRLDEVEIKSNVHKLTPFNGSKEVTKEEIAPINHGQDVPVLLQWQPSVTTTTDAGAGVGYTSMRIRGVEQSRINVTVNDIPINDAESQGVFWVDLPDIASSTESIRIQRGVGPSTNGAGAYGGTVSLNTFGLDVNPSAAADVSFGSFNTRKMTFRLNSGLMNNRFNVDARYSIIKSDGYIDRASADLKSWYIEGARVGNTSSLRLLAFSGSEITYQAWNGVPEARVYNRDAQLLNHYYNNQSSLYPTVADSLNLFNSDRRYNANLYENQVDNYNQTHVQLHYAKVLGSGWKGRLAGHYTKGKGYFEQFRFNDDFSKYNLSPVINNGDTITSSDLVRRRWLDNDFVGAIFKVEKEMNANSLLSIGGGYHSYFGNHFGEVISVAALPDYDFTSPYYESEATKHDGNVYIRWEHKLSTGWAWSADAQLRKVQYKSNGIDNDLRAINFDVNYLFFNPKLSVTRKTGKNAALSASFAMAHREPDRSDFTDHGKQDLPRPERLYDTELSYKSDHVNWNIELNGYYMAYKDQLIPTGQLNDVGNTLRKNTPDSYRLGIEWIGRYAVRSDLNAGINLTVSRNKIADFKEIIYDYTNGLETVEINRGQTNISLSPGLVGAFTLGYTPANRLKIDWITKVTGKQYLDNSSLDNRSIPAYSTSHLNVTYGLKTKWAKDLTLKLQANNIFNAKFVSGGYTYSYIYIREITENFLYPQAGIHVNLGLSIIL